jgi:SAM-dependent methyltransferase
VRDEHREIVKARILDEDTFVRAVFSGRRRGCALSWRQVTVRPVAIRGERHLQFSYLDDKQDITRNYTDEAEHMLDELLSMPFSSIDVRTTEGPLQVQVTRKGRFIVHQHKAPVQSIQPSLEHDRRKDLPLPVDKPDPFLQAIGIMARSGRVRARMRSKFRQINEFLRLLTETGDWRRGERPLQIIDCGCGSAHLTFSVYHYLNHILRVPAYVVGVDVNEALIGRQIEQVRELGWEGIRFEASSVIDFQPDTAPDVVLALHACDTATDEALARAVQWGSEMLFAVPCCQHHLQQQLRGPAVPEVFHPVLRHGILRERMGDLLTDAFRAGLLRIAGYQADVVEFISTEHTAKNLMIRAVRSEAVDRVSAAREYGALCAYWGVEPYLAKLLGVGLAGRVDTSPNA